MSQPELLKRAVAVLESMGIPHMLTGSLVSTIQGEPRSTHDIDLVVSIRPDDASQLARAFPAPNFYLDEIAIREAIRRQNMFNLLETTTGDKIDFGFLPTSRSIKSVLLGENPNGCSVSPSVFRRRKTRFFKSSAGSKSGDRARSSFEMRSAYTRCSTIGSIWRIWNAGSIHWMCVIYGCDSRPKPLHCETPHEDLNRFLFQIGTRASDNPWSWESLRGIPPWQI